MVSFTVGAKSARRSRPLSVPSRLANTMVATSITINVATSINKRLCQHADDKSPIESTMVWLGRCHLAFAVAKCVFNLRFAAALSDAAATAESCDGLLARPSQRNCFLHHDKTTCTLNSYNKVINSWGLLTYIHKHLSNTFFTNCFWFIWMLFSNREF